MATTFKIAADKIDAVATCLRPLAGVGVIRAADALAVEVYAPFDAARLDKVRAVILGIDPGAIEL